MAATGADAAVARTLRRAAAGGDKPGYGPISPYLDVGFSLPEGFYVERFGKAGTRMSDGCRPRASTTARPRTTRAAGASR